MNTLLLLLALLAAAAALQIEITEEPEAETCHDDNLLWNDDGHCWESLDGSPLSELPPNTFPTTICPCFRKPVMTAIRQMPWWERGLEVLAVGAMLLFIALVMNWLNKPASIV